MGGQGMTQKSVDLKGKKVLRSIELHKDLKPEAVRRMLNELSADATKRAHTQVIQVIIISD
jgi:DNA-binding protein YbaB